MTNENIYPLSKIGKALEQFSKNEFAQLCLEFNIDVESFTPKPNTDFKLIMISYMERRGFLGEMVAVCKRVRPDLAWSELNRGEESVQSLKIPKQKIKKFSELLAKFSDEDIDSLLKDLNIRELDIMFPTRTISLVNDCKRKGTLPNLVMRMKQIRPDLDWSS